VAGICEAGHRSATDDYCDVCGLPVRPLGGPVPPAPSPLPPSSQRCPNCGAANPLDALFCEACGYDYTTGTLPRSDVAGMLGLRPSDAPRAAGVPEDAGDTGDTGDDDASPLADAAEPPGQLDPAAGAAEQPPEPAGLPAPTAPAEQDAQAEQDAPAGIEASPLDDSPTKGRPAPRRETFVAEVWIDPDWYDVQSSPDAMPSVGLPETVKLSASNLIGRESRSRGIVPEVDCGVDTGCSRRQAMLTTDGRRWYVEDLASANGTYVGPAAGPLPTEPIVGRKELGPDDRIYVGAWTRIVVRKASREEIDALG